MSNKVVITDKSTGLFVTDAQGEETFLGQRGAEGSDRESKANLDSHRRHRCLTGQGVRDSLFLTPQSGSARGGIQQRRKLSAILVNYVIVNNQHCWFRPNLSRPTGAERASIQGIYILSKVWEGHCSPFGGPLNIIYDSATAKLYTYRPLSAEDSLAEQRWFKEVSRTIDLPSLLTYEEMSQTWGLLPSVVGTISLATAPRREIARQLALPPSPTAISTMLNRMSIDGLDNQSLEDHGPVTSTSQLQNIPPHLRGRPVEEGGSESSIRVSGSRVPIDGFLKSRTQKSYSVYPFPSPLH
ncbi:hypothetical protein TREMEDRAFT_65298 [Tremella mesenterica DSM 1558]|uniref:uncharacterized protein n=1 Tax=Tremella mesenterica (strain ATCC 24925 / CBS 8224 / DSM 1558 / NBRC 9311 / NRRL Y-6157 / RJB 2259-6 / UBC 559-6) TaxID=578456 RepID=UPI00032C0FCF|nr:uncharacterized protein TREMEDRAFT_65298 [Tremella mesenterica DSM 1558]EIW66445.1 hypothetical protein TREMEDRAFT_65298 [Tremella mesenterica DSM 1558]